MRVLDLFSGVGMFAYGMEKAGHEVVAFCEIEEFPRKVLRKHWPDVPIYEDVRELNGEQIGSIDIITGGFPCQDLSVAGKQAGIRGERSGLFDEVIRLAGELRPRYIILENVAALLTGDSGGWARYVFGRLTEIGFDAEWHVIPAGNPDGLSAGAPHRRERVWIVAHPPREQRDGINDQPRNMPRPEAVSETGNGSGESNISYAERERGCSGNTSREYAEDVGQLRGSEGQDKGRMETGSTEPDLGLRSDGASNGLSGTGGLNGKTAKTRPAEKVQAMQPQDAPEAHQGSVRGHGGFLAEGLLQPLLHGTGLCQVCAVKAGLSPRGPEDAWDIVRELWGRETPCRPSRRRELEKQLTREYPDIMRFLSRHTPSPCKTCWTDGSWEDGTPRVAKGVPDRANKLKALGNGLVWQIPYAIGSAIEEREMPW